MRCFSCNLNLFGDKIQVAQPEIFLESKLHENIADGKGYSKMIINLIAILLKFGKKKNTKSNEKNLYEHSEISFTS